MNRKLKTSLALTLCALVAASWFVIRARSGPAVTVTLRISVNPTEQSSFVTEQANSARFKYMVGKKSGVRPVQAQKLTVKPLPDSGLLEARLGVQTKDEAQRYAEAFVQTLQGQCGARAQVALTQQTIR